MGGEELDSDESDWEPEAEVMPVQRETRSGRQRKRPSFFQEFESQENNLDSILAEFEQTQAKEFGKPREPKPPPKPPSERRPRKRKQVTPAVEKEEAPVEVETLRSGRKRKVRRVLNAFMDEDEDEKLRRGASSDDDDFEPPPEEEVEKIEENDDLIEEDEELDEDLEDEDEEYDSDNPRPRKHRDSALPPKKRGRPKKILTDAEIEEATRAAMGAKPVIEITRVPRAGDAPAEGTVATVNAPGQPSVIMGPGEAPVTTLTGLVSTPVVDTGAVINTGVLTTGVIVAQPIDGLAGQPVDGLAQLAAVVAAPVNGVPVVTAKKSAPVLSSEDTQEPSKVQPTWVNESLDDDENTVQDTTVAVSASADMNVEGAFNPLAVNAEVDENPLNIDSGVSNPLESGSSSQQESNLSNPLEDGVTESLSGVSSNPLSSHVSNPLEGTVTTNSLDCGVTNSINNGHVMNTSVTEEETAACESETQVEQQPLNEEDALLATATEQPPFVNECQEEGEAVMENPGLLSGGSDNPLEGIDGHESEPSEAKSSETDPFSSEQQGSEKPPEQCEQAALSEEDLLTGPAHNLDDTQYKADYVDPNLDDI